MRTALLSMLLLAGCGGGSGASWVAQVRAADARAEEQIRRKEFTGARRTLAHVLELEAPRAVAHDDLQNVEADTLFRMAELALQEGDARQAETEATRGLALGGIAPLFRANLLTVRGRARERLGADSGAVDDYGQALRINEQLLNELTEAKQ